MDDDKKQPNIKYRAKIIKLPMAVMPTPPEQQLKGKKPHKPKDHAEVLAEHIEKMDLHGYAVVRKIMGTEGFKIDILLEMEDGGTFRYEFIQKDRDSQSRLYSATTIEYEFNHCYGIDQARALHGEVSAIIPFEGKNKMKIIGIKNQKSFIDFLK